MVATGAPQGGAFLTAVSFSGCHKADTGFLCLHQPPRPEMAFRAESLSILLP